MPETRHRNGNGFGAVVPAGLFVAIGLALAGYFIGHGFTEARARDRYVTVRGFAEREVAADLAIWPIVFAVTADELSELQAAVDADVRAVRGFLGTDFGPNDISVSAPRVQDRQAQGVYGSDRANFDRYTAEVTVTVRTPDIDKARQAMERSGALVREGVAVIRSYEYQTQYLYTQLETIKPEMIAEATRDARTAAEQFAEDSGSAVGSIRNAQQGYFSIEDRDPFSPEHKKVRVVTTIQYFLED